jgi:hypothetical protein
VAWGTRWAATSPFILGGRFLPRPSELSTGVERNVRLHLACGSCISDMVTLQQQVVRLLDGRCSFVASMSIQCMCGDPLRGDRGRSSSRSSDVRFGKWQERCEELYKLESHCKHRVGWLSLHALADALVERPLYRRTVLTSGNTEAVLGS